jgi:hypothetical protein
MGREIIAEAVAAIGSVVRTSGNIMLARVHRDIVCAEGTMPRHGTTQAAELTEAASAWVGLVSREAVAGPPPGWLE